MVVGFAELGGTIGLFPTLCLQTSDLEFRLGFGLKILLLQPPAHWGSRCLPRLLLPFPQRPAVAVPQGTAVTHAHNVRALCWAPAQMASILLWSLTGWWRLDLDADETDTHGYLSDFGIPDSRGTQNGRGQYMSLESQVKRGGLCAARLPDPCVFSPTERREAAREPVHLRADASTGGDDPQLQVGWPAQELAFPYPPTRCQKLPRHTWHLMEPRVPWVGGGGEPSVNLSCPCPICQARGQAGVARFCGHLAGDREKGH